MVNATKGLLISCNSKSNSATSHNSTEIVHKPTDRAAKTFLCVKEVVEVVVRADKRIKDSKEVMEDEDELRRRAEEFIEKINSAWKAEKLIPQALG